MAVPLNQKEKAAGTVLTNEAIPTDQLNPETARTELAEATAHVATDEKSYQDRERRIRRARAMQELAQK